MKRETESRMYSLRELRDGQLSKFSPAIQTFTRTHKDTLKRLPDRELNSTITDKSLISVPSEVIEAAQKIAELSQHKFLTTWLSKAMEKDSIIITENDKNIHTDINFNKMGGILYSYRDEILKVDTDSPDIQQDVVNRIRSTVATNRITHAVVKETMDGVSRILWIGAIAGIAETVFQRTVGMKPLAYAIASTTDNLAAIIAEARKLFRQGYSKKEIVTSMAIPAAILTTAVGVSFLVDHQFQECNNTAAGLAYGGESAICVFPSILAAVTSLRPEYEKLVKEGKVNDPKMMKILEKDNRTIVGEIQRWLVGSQRALAHDLAYPHHVGLYIGATVGIVLSAITANIPTGEGRCLMQNPIVLIPLGIADGVGGALASSLTDQIYDRSLRKNLKKIKKS